MAEDNVNHPKHYNSHPSGVECITVVEHYGFNIGNAIKYVFRAGHKGVLAEDLRKSSWYLRREAERLDRFEVWRPAVGVPLEVSCIGRVRGVRGVRGLQATKAGYLSVMTGRGHLHYVHKLVAETFIGPCPFAHEIAHNDGNRRNNAATNLRFATRESNAADRRAHGTLNSGDRNGQSKLSWEHVDRIRAESASTSDSVLSSKYGISRMAIARIRRGSAWAEKYRRGRPVDAIMAVEPSGSPLRLILECIRQTGGTVSEALREVANRLDTQADALAKGT